MTRGLLNDGYLPLVLLGLYGRNGRSPAPQFPDGPEAGPTPSKAT